MPRYFLTPQTHLCCVDGTAIFLDLKRNEYCAIGLAETAALSAMLVGWPRDAGAADAARDRQRAAEMHPAPPTPASAVVDVVTPGQRLPAPTEPMRSAPSAEEDSAAPTALEAAACIEELLAQGLITADAAHGKPVTVLDVVPPAPPAIASAIAIPSITASTTASATDNAITTAPAPAPGIRAGHVLRFFYAYTCAKWLLRFASVERAVRRVQRRRQRALARMAAAAPAARAQQLYALVRIFNRLRPFAYTASKACLLNSLTLLEFLAQYGLHPRWVFGVQVNPFIAHCWVQEDTWVLNGSAQFTGDFIPILVA